MKAVRSTFILIFLMSGVFACGEPPRVLQGTVTGYDSSSKILTVKDELGQHQERLFSLKEAELGAEPVAGDAVRLSYYDKDGQLVATRLMNLTRQQEIGKLSKDKEKQ